MTWQKLILALLITIFLIFQTKKLNKKHKKEYNVGYSIPMTGNLSVYGRAVRNGLAVAIDTYPKIFDKINFIFEDNKYSTSESITAFLRLKTKYNPAIIYNWGELPFHAISTTVEKLKIPTLVTSLDEQSHIKKTNVIRVGNTAENMMRALAEYFKANNFNRIGIIKTEDPFFDRYLKAFNIFNSQINVELISAILSDDVNLESQALRLKSLEEDFDTFGIFLNPGQINSIYKNLTNLKFAKPTFGTDTFEVEEEILSSGKIIDNAPYVSFEIPKWFEEKYYSEFNSKDQISYAYNSFVVAIIIGETLTNNYSKDPSMIYNSILDFYPKKYNLDLELISYENGDRIWQMPVEMKRVKFVPIP